MQKKLNGSYPFWVWVSSLLLGSIFWNVANNLIHNGKPAIDSSVMILAYYSFILSLPTMLAYCAAFWLIGTRIYSGVICKTLLSLVAIFGLLATIFVLADLSSTTILLASYSTAILICGYMIRLYEIIKPASPAS